MGFMPFRDASAYGAFQNHREKVRNQIRDLQNSVVLSMAPSELEVRFLKDALIEPLVLHADQLHQLDKRTILVDGRMDPNSFLFPGDHIPHISGTLLSVAIPFEGDEELWKIQPSSSLSGCPEIDVRGDVIVLHYEFADAAASNEGKAAEL